MRRRGVWLGDSWLLGATGLCDVEKLLWNARKMHATKVTGAVLLFVDKKWGPCKVRNETETKRNETKQIETKRNKSKRNETDRNETTQIETKRNKTKRNKSKRNETNYMASHCRQKSVFSNIRKLFSYIRKWFSNITNPISYIRNSFSNIRK